jgi:hypothetical protein
MSRKDQTVVIQGERALTEAHTGYGVTIARGRVCYPTSELFIKPWRAAMTLRFSRTL